jgi:hypothetical protein
MAMEIMVMEKAAAVERHNCVGRDKPMRLNGCVRLDKTMRRAKPMRLPE